MSRISLAFQKRKALITFITAGDPSLAVTEKLIYQLEQAGADIIELGIPFSDPLADGPVIQASHERALKNNVSLAEVFALVKKVRRKTSIPLCFMLSYNLVVQYGEEKFYADCERFGIDGVIVPDLPPEEKPLLVSLRSTFSPLVRGRKEEGVSSIGFISPTSSDERIKLAAQKSSGFIYLIAATGITGKRKEVDRLIGGRVERIKKYTRLPVAIGFGISGPQQAAEAARLADGVIVGSAIVDLIGNKKLSAVPRFVASLRRAIDAR